VRYSSGLVEEEKMGVLTLQNYRDDLGAATAGALQRSNIGNALIDRWVNQAVKEFGYALKFHELEASVDFPTILNTPAYLITGLGITDFRHIEEMWITDSASGTISRVRPETRTKYRKNLGVPTDTESFALPTWYHKFGGSLYLRPTPDAVYTVSMDYFTTLTPFVSGPDVSPFHEDWDEVIFVGALYRGFRHFGEFDRYQNVRNDFLGLVRSRQTEYELEEFPEGGISPLGPNDTQDVEEAQ
jgi:hypothetical protein